MAPPRLAACKVCNKKDAGKYRCPIDHVDYCSVVCFKQHKEKDCRSQQTYNPPPLPILAPTTTSTRRSDDDDDDDKSSRPTKRLRDLHWPAEPSSLIYDDPLSRDDVKPLRPFEFEAIATAPSLRALISSTSLRSTLTRLSNVSTSRSNRSLREPALRVLLGLAADPTPNQYRPDPQRKFATGVTTRDEERRIAQEQYQQQFHSPNYRGRGGGGRGTARGRGGGGGGGGGGGARGTGGHDARLIESTPDERKEMAEFVLEVRKVLERARQNKGEV